MIKKNNYYDKNGNLIKVGDLLVSTFDNSKYYFCGYCFYKEKNHQLYHNINDFWVKEVLNGWKFTDLIISEKIEIPDLIDKVILYDGGILNSLVKYFFEEEGK